MSEALTVAGLFEAQFGAAPTGVWSAPGRVNLIGEHTDYNLGFVFPFAINRRTYAAIRLRDDDRIRLGSSIAKRDEGGSGPANYRITETTLGAISRDAVSGWSAYPLGVAWALRAAAEERQLGAERITGFDCFIDSDVPLGAGLSSSAAIECAVALALNELWGLGLSRRELARVGQRAENEIVGAPTGIMDQSASLLGELDHGVFLDCRSLEAEVIELGFAAAGLELLIIDTRVAHRHSDGGYRVRREACERGAETLGVASLRELSIADLPRAEASLTEQDYRRVRHVITENQRVLDTVQTLRERGPRAIGELLYQSHQSMRDDFEISIDELDSAVETSLRSGAIGARMTGGGFGGAAIALVPVERVGAVSLAVKAEFEQLGYEEPNIFAVSAAPGARREAT